MSIFNEVEEKQPAQKKWLRVLLVVILAVTVLAAIVHFSKVKSQHLAMQASTPATAIPAPAPQQPVQVATPTQSPSTDSSASTGNGNAAHTPCAFGFSTSPECDGPTELGAEVDTTLHTVGGTCTMTTQKQLNNRIENLAAVYSVNSSDERCGWNFEGSQAPDYGLKRAMLAGTIRQYIKDCVSPKALSDIDNRVMDISKVLSTSSCQVIENSARLVHEQTLSLQLPPQMETTTPAQQQ
jgi:hypothetical protein